MTTATSGTTTQAFQYAAPNIWPVSNNVRIYHVRDHTQYSLGVTLHFLSADHAGGKDDADFPRILAICAYSPSFFYRLIINGIEAAVANKVQGFSDADLNALNAFKVDCQPDSLLFPARDYTLAKQSFLKGAQAVMPHFTAFQPYDEHVTRLCCFGPLDDWFNPQMCAFDHYKDYRRRFLKRNPFYTSYAFFHWLNGTNRCFVIPPYSWSAWGLSDPWDFAIFRSRALLEYHNARKMCLHVEPLESGWDWKFVATEALLSRVATAHKTQNWSGLSDIQTFLQTMYGDSNTLGALSGRVSRKLQQLKKALKDNEDDPNTRRMLQGVADVERKLPGEGSVGTLVQLARDLEKGLSKYTDKNDRDALHKSLSNYLNNVESYAKGLFQD